MRKILIPTAALLAFCFTAAEAETIRTTTAEEYAAAMQEYVPASDTSLFAMGIQSDESSNILLAAYDGSLDGQGALYDIWDEYNIHTLIYETAEETASAYEYYVSNEIPVCYNEKMTLQASRPTAYMPYLSWGSAYVNTSWLTSQLELHFSSVANMPEITVVEIDSGIDYTHPELKGRIDTASGYDFYNTDSDPMDDNSHGTHVAGIIADNTLANVKIIPLKISDSQGNITYEILKLALQKANELKPDIINMSLGANSEDTSCGKKKVYKEIFDRAHSNNTIICAAAGNGALNADYIFPAYMDNVITVANSTNTGGISSSSNYGTVIELAAPGTSIYSTIPVSKGSYDSKNGTSMACPFVTAAVAMMRTYYKDITYEEAVKVLRTNTTAFSSSVNTAKGYGSGILNMKGLIPEITPAPTASPTPSPSPSPSPTPSPAPSPSPSPTVEPDEYGVEITKQSSGNLFVSVRKEHLMYAAQYDSDGVLLSILQKNSSFLLTPSADASEIKIFIWDEEHSMMPLTTVKSYILSDK